ncbi:MAG: histidine phosphatase family protein [Peptostreptococcaceae bacterium]|nr:histidine phosphatase family protein [Peptostreptococcaceae bacterium]MDY5739306.1 histidine phosphatase family protein [Anaerovoracaceae bacterium]
MESRIYFIRHGITEGNQKRWYYGASDIPLAHEGVEKLLEMAEENPYPTGDDVQFFTSGLLRTEETLKILFGEREHDTIPRLQEMNFGEFECHSYEELKDDEDFDAWVNDEVGDVAMPGGESRNQFADRISRGVKELVAKHRLKELSHRHSGDSATTVMVCHGGVTAMAILTLFPEETETWWELIPDPGHGYMVEFDSGVPKSFTKL